MHLDKSIEDLISFHKNIKKLAHFTTIKLINDDLEFLNRIPKILYLLEKHNQEVNKQEGDALQNVKNDLDSGAGNFLLPSTFDFLRYTHLFLFEDFFHIGAPASNLTSTIYFIGSRPTTIPYYHRSKHHYLSNRHDNTDDSVNGFRELILSWDIRTQYSFMCVSVDITNNWLAYIYNGHNFKDEDSRLDVKKYLMAIISFKQIMEGIYANKPVDMEFLKVANSFRLLDQLSNMICGLENIRSGAINENNVFDILLNSKDFVVNSINELFKERDDQLKKSFVGLVQKVFDDVNRKGLDSDILKEFRNSYTHGIYPIESKKENDQKRKEATENNLKARFKRVFEQSKNVDTLIFLLPQILIMAAGRSPEDFLRYVKKKLEQKSKSNP